MDLEDRAAASRLFQVEVANVAWELGRDHPMFDRLMAAITRHNRAAISPDVILGLLDRIAELEKAPHSIQPTDLTGEDGERTGLCGFCRQPIYENGDLRGGRFRHGEYARSSSKVETGVEK